MDHKIVVGLLEIPREHFCKDIRTGTHVYGYKLDPTITAGIEVDDIADSYVDDAEKALILLLELLLVEDLHREDAVFGDSPVKIC